MDFFSAQDRARAHTRTLVVYFIFGCAGLVVSIYAVVMAAFGFVNQEGPLVWWRADVFGIVSLGTLAVVGLASLSKMAALRAGGGAVARSVGGVLVPPGTTDPALRRLRNIVEEMALASGVPVPEIYVLEDEPGINAFAAGFRPNDAAVAVTRGCVNQLSRDELQGVVAHEFSHILNGDMHLNMKLIGAVFGLLVLTVVGRIILRAAGSVRGGRKNNQAQLAFFVLGLALVVLGWLGVLFGRLIQAAISRQREFLADASAVQFTRNPDGIAGALKKIGGVGAGSTVGHAHAQETAHMFFAPVFAYGFATHPPLAARIRAIEPSWDGKFVQPRNVDEAPRAPAAVRLPPRLAPVPLNKLVAAAGMMDAASIAAIQQWRDSLPDPVRAALATAQGCRALVLALALDENPEVASAQLMLLRSKYEPAANDAMQLAAQVQQIPEGIRLPLFELALAGLAGTVAAGRASLLERLRELVHLDHQETMHEMALLRLADVRLNPQPPAPHPHEAPADPGDVALVLSALAHVDSPNDAAAVHAFEQGRKMAPGILGRTGLTPRANISLDEVEAACARLEKAPFAVKKQILEAGASVAARDGVIAPIEVETLRAIAASLGCPLPPL